MTNGLRPCLFGHYLYYFINFIQNTSLQYPGEIFIIRNENDSVQIHAKRHV